MYKVAVFISGGGTNLQALLDAQADGVFANGRITLVVADRKSAGGLQRAESTGIATAFVPRKTQQRLTGLLQEQDIDFIVLSGYLSILPEEVIKTYRNRIINIHPALTPLFSGMGFYGLKVHEAVLASGVKVTGATVHFADEGVDTGMIIAQRAVPVLPGDTPETLRDRVLDTEHILLVETVQALTDDRVHTGGGRAWIEPDTRAADDTARTHRLLNRVFALAEETRQRLTAAGITTALAFMPANYIKINNRYEKQHYPIPVITAQGGDMVFNLDGVAFERFFSVAQFALLDLQPLFTTFNVEVYGGEDCLTDFYRPGMDAAAVKAQVAASNQQTVGVAGYITLQNAEDIIQAYNAFNHALK